MNRPTRHCESTHSDFVADQRPACEGESLAGFGRWTEEGDWLLVEDMAPGQVPELVAAIVSLGGQVEAVVPEQQSLEERFLELLGES